MSGGIEALQLKEEDVTKLLAAGVHLGSSNVDYQMESYVFKRKPDGVHIINVRKTWEKLLLAARIIVGIENPADVCVISARPYGQRAILKFATHTGATAVAGRFTPGTFTNQIQAAFKEPRLLVICDPRTDQQPVTEASYVNIPVIAFCNTDSPLCHVDVAIPCNNKGAHSVGLMWWLLAREVLRMRGSISRQHAWEVMPDLYFYRDPEDVEKDVMEREQEEQPQPATTFPSTDWVGSTDQGTGEWGAEQMGAPTVPSTMVGGEEWGTSKDWDTDVPSAPLKDWADAPSKDWADAPSKDWADAPSKDWAAPSKDWGDSEPKEWGTEDVTKGSDWGSAVADGSGADWA